MAAETEIDIFLLKNRMNLNARVKLSGQSIFYRNPLTARENVSVKCFTLRTRGHTL